MGNATSVDPWDAFPRERNKKPACACARRREGGCKLKATPEKSITEVDLSFLPSFLSKIYFAQMVDSDIFVKLSEIFTWKSQPPLKLHSKITSFMVAMQECVSWQNAVWLLNGKMASTHLPACS